MKAKWFCIFPAALLSSGPLVACEPESIVTRYLTAIDDMKWEQMRSYLADDAIYIDPTMTHFEQPAIDLEGADNIVEFWRSSSENSGTSNIDYTTTSCFQTAGYYVVNLDVSASVSGAYWNVDKDVIDLSGRVVSILRLRGDLVIEHHDYVEYAALDAEVERLREEYGEASPDD